MAQRKAHVIDDRERTDDIHIDENVDFEKMYLSEHVLAGLTASGFERPSPIQLAAIPLGRCGLDMVVQAKSGTGKTCVFAVVALEMVSVAAATTQVLVLTPTREIAVQVTQVMNAIGSKMTGLKASAFIGGINLTLDKAKLRCCHIAVGTPGRITQLIEMGLLKLDNIRLFVLDEADQLLTGQFADSIAHIASGLPLNKQVLALSATYTEEVAKVAETLMRSPNHVRLDRDAPALIGINQYVKLLPYHSQLPYRQKTKFRELISILSTVTFNQCLVFSNSQLRAESICNKLRASGWPVSFLSGGQAQQDRLMALNALCSYKCRVLVSTDLAARGLDSEHVDFVINMDVPRDHATYLHRIGRAGRFGSRGIAVTLATEGDEWCTVRAIASLGNLRIIMLKENVDVNKNNQHELHEFVEYLTDDDYSQFLNSDHVRENDNIKTSKGKGKGSRPSGTVKAISRNLGKEVIDKNVNGGIQENSPLNMNGSKESSKEERKRSEMIKRNQEDLEAKAKTLKSVKNVLKKIYVEQPSSSVCFQKILNEVSEKYNSISADDTPSVAIPSIPGAFEVSLMEEKDFAAYLNTVEEKLQETVISVNSSWTDFMFSVENALRARAEGKECDVLLQKNFNGEEVNSSSMSVGKWADGNTPVKKMAEFSSSSSDDSVTKSGIKQVTNGHYSCDDSVRSSSKKSSVGCQNSKRPRTRREKVSRKSRSDEYKNQSHQSSYKGYPEYDYGVEMNENLFTSYNQDQLNDWYTSWSKDNDYCNESLTKDYIRGYEDLVRQNLAVQHKYIERAQNFSAMFDYVQTMGKISFQIARDYHYGQ